MLQLIQVTTGWLHSFGVLAVFVVLLAESLGVPSPSEIILLLSGLLVAEGRFQFVPVVLAGTAGSTLGASIAYWIARRGGRPLLLTRLRFLFRTEARLDAWDRYFLTRGDWIILVGRILSGVRMLISYPAGLFRMPFPRFFLFTLIGAMLWPILATGAGWYLGPRVLSALKTLHSAEEVVLAAAVLAAGVLWIWLSRRRGASPDTPRRDR